MKQHVGEASISHDVLVGPEADVHWSGFAGLLRNKHAGQEKNAQFVGWDQNDDGHKHMGFTMCISQSGGLLTGVLTNTF